MVVVVRHPWQIDLLKRGFVSLTNAMCGCHVIAPNRRDRLPEILVQQRLEIGVENLQFLLIINQRQDFRVS